MPPAGKPRPSAGGSGGLSGLSAGANQNSYSKIIVCLGRISATRIIDPGFKVTKQHGQWVEKGGIHMMGTFHPAALLRNPGNKPGALEDFLGLRKKSASYVQKYMSCKRLSAVENIKRDAQDKNPEASIFLENDRCTGQNPPKKGRVVQPSLRGQRFLSVSKQATGARLPSVTLRISHAVYSDGSRVRRYPPLLPRTPWIRPSFSKGRQSVLNI